jgi:hypothetical protein
MLREPALAARPAWAINGLPSSILMGIRHPSEARDCCARPVIIETRFAVLPDVPPG